MAFVRTLILPFCLFAAAPTPVMAQKMTSDEFQIALNRGQLLYAYDQAAWHATDAMIADAKKRGLMDALPQMLGGWIVMGTPDEPKVLFFDRHGNDPRAVYIVHLADGGTRVASMQFVETEEDRRIDNEGLSLIHARDIALSSLAGVELLRCAKGLWNTVVLPPDEPGGPSLVYVLSPQDTLDIAPAGGHYRIEVSADGKPSPPHAFSKSCINLPTDQAEAKPTGLMVTQLMDPVPTEVSVFTMFVTKLPLYVLTTANEHTWVVGAVRGQAYIELLSDKLKKAPSAKDVKGQ